MLRVHRAEETVACPVIGELAEQIVFSTAFPHPECPFPDGVRELLKMPRDDELKRRILWDNPCRLYGIAA